jgi:hypothetical protein
MTSGGLMSRAAVALAVAVGLVGLVGLAAPVSAAGPAAGPAAATAAPAVAPTVKTFTTGVIDAMPTWERENGCSPTEKPGPRYLRRLLLATYGPVSSNIVRECTAADSGHEEGRALDWMVSVRVPEQKALGDAFVTWLQAPDGYGNAEAMARRLGISYVIWNNQTWRAYDPARGWTEYNGCLAKKKRKKAYDTFCHRNHVHISFTWDGALKRTSYYSGYVACPAPVPSLPAYPSRPVEPPVLGTPTTPPLDLATAPVVPLPPARVLGTKAGVGTPAGRCRVHPDVRLDVPVLGVGGVPLTGVAAVVLRVRILKPDAVPVLKAWAADGSAAPVQAVPLDETGRTAQVLAPVGPTGAVSLQLAGAMAHLRADVLGYVAAPAPTAAPAA